jgi:hypothetical protein
MLNKSYIIFLLALFFGCANTQDTSLNKLDPALRKQVIEHQQNNTQELISFIGETKTALDSTMEESIKSSGIEINSFSKDIFTGKGTYDAILKLLNKDYIKSLEANKPLAPNVNN